MSSPMREVVRRITPAPVRKLYRTVAEKLTQQRYARCSLPEVFTLIYQKNHWRSPESRSGVGSEVAVTEHVREMLPPLCREFGVRSMLDAPCGDLNWMRHVDLVGIDYIGCDIVPEIVEQNQCVHAAPGRKFIQSDITCDDLPRVDMIFCRDCLFHLSYANIGKALERFVLSGSKYLLTTTYPDVGQNQEIVDGWFRPINLQIEPFNFPEPVRLIHEITATSGDADDRGKCLGLWTLDSLAASR